MPTSTEEIDIAKLLINGRQGRAFRDFDRDMKEWLKAQYMHMSKAGVGTCWGGAWGGAVAHGMSCVEHSAAHGT